MQKSLVIAASAAAAIGAVVTAPGAQAAQTYTVANASSPANCAKNASFTSIQAAVDAAPAGSKINVCPGTYQEYVTVPAAKSGLQLKGLGGDPISSNGQAPVILYPPTPNLDPAAFDPNALVTVNGATGVSFDSLVVSGPFTDTACEGAQTTHYGVFIIGGGSATLKHDVITKIRPVDDSLLGCQDGVGLRAGSSFLGQVGSVVLQDSVVNRYEKGGVVVDGPGSSGVIQNNVVTGDGPTGLTAQNGIQVSRGATGSVQGNTVTANEYTGDGTYSAGITLYQAGTGVTAQSNKLSDNDVGLDVYASPAATLKDNQVSTTSANVWAAGTYLQDQSGTTLKNNKFSGGTEGIASFNVTSATFENNKVDGASGDGIYNDASSTGNTDTNNQAFGSGTFDCQDDSHDGGTAGTANTWTNDKGDTSSPAGICRH